MLDLVTSAIQVLTRCSDAATQSDELRAKLAPLTQPALRTRQLTTTSIASPARAPAPAQRAARAASGLCRAGGASSVASHVGSQSDSLMTDRDVASTASPRVSSVSAGECDGAVAVRGVTSAPSALQAGPNSAKSVACVQPCDVQFAPQVVEPAVDACGEGRRAAAPAAPLPAQSDAAPEQMPPPPPPPPPAPEAPLPAPPPVSRSEPQQLTEASGIADEAPQSRQDEKAAPASDGARRPARRATSRASHKRERSSPAEVPPAKHQASSKAPAPSKAPKPQSVPQLARYSPTWRAASSSFSCNFPYRVADGVRREQALQERKSVLKEPMVSTRPPKAPPRGRKAGAAKDGARTARSAQHKASDNALAPWPMVRVVASPGRLLQCVDQGRRIRQGGACRLNRRAGRRFEARPARHRWQAVLMSLRRARRRCRHRATLPRLTRRKRRASSLRSAHISSRLLRRRLSCLSCSVIVMGRQLRGCQSTGLCQEPKLQPLSAHSLQRSLQTHAMVTAWLRTGLTGRLQARCSCTRALGMRQTSQQGRSQNLKPTGAIPQDCVLFPLRCLRFAALLR